MTLGWRRPWLALAAAAATAGGNKEWWRAKFGGQNSVGIPWCPSWWANGIGNEKSGRPGIEI